MSFGQIYRPSQSILFVAKWSAIHCPVCLTEQVLLALIPYILSRASSVICRRACQPLCYHSMANENSCLVVVRNNLLPLREPTHRILTQLLLDDPTGVLDTQSGGIVDGLLNKAAAGKPEKNTRLFLHQIVFRTYNHHRCSRSSCRRQF